MIRLKRVILALLGATMAITLSAAPVTREQAKKNAVDFLKNVKGSRTLAPVQNRQKLGPRRAKATSTDTDLYYVFNRGNNEGYVIVSGDDQTLPIIGYTEEGEFDYAKLPDNMRHWLDMREQELLALSTEMGSGPRYVLSTHDKIAPMVTTKWNQGAPFNDECPMYFTLGRSVTGCVATAMAQVLYFQRAKSVIEVQADIPGYTCWTTHETYGNLQVEGIEAGSPIDWDNMIDSYGSSATAKQKKAVAQLMHYCGVSVKMDYTNKSSGAQSGEVPGAFQKYFGYGSQTKIVYQSNYNEEAWDKLLYNELAQGRPFYLSGYNEDGGHAFVCDGYDGNYCYHINWGWGGSSDGYYMMSKLNPGSQGIGGSSGGYSEGEAAVIGCEPENYSEKAMPIANATVKRLCIAHFDANGDGIFSFGEAAAVKDIGDVFKGQTTITAFEELYNFTSLETLSDDAFNGCLKLANVKLPKAMKHIGKRAFANCRVLKTFKLSDVLETIGDSAFANCRVLPNLQIPSGITRIEDNTFENCLAFTEVELPIGIRHIGKEAFKGCTKLATVTVKSVKPQEITLGSNVFADIDLSAATLNTLQGTRAYFAQADQWKEFGNLYEERTLSQGKYAQLEENKDYYLYNVGTGYYMTKGEAWSTQAIVDDTNTPMRFQFKHPTSMGEGVYYLSSNDTGSDKKILFRTNTDGNVGNGVNACFVDGTLSAKCYWKVALVEGTDNVYTLQIPSNGTGYNAAQYLGVDLGHASNAASPTYGAYSDIVYADHPQNCQWMLVAYDAAEMARFNKAQVLKNLLTIGKTKRAEMSMEQAIYDNLESSVEDIDKACRKLRKKLNFINFNDEVVREVAVTHYDIDGNGEISHSEASSLDGFGTEFQGKTIIDGSDLKYFTKATYMTGNGFKSCVRLKNVVLPENITDIYYRVFMSCTNLESISIEKNVSYIGDEAFYGCTKLNEVRIAVENPNHIQLGTDVFKNVKRATATLYVPQGCRDIYANAPEWKEFGTIKEMRANKTPDYAELAENTSFYVYNIGQLRSIMQGEAYGTQAVVGLNGFVYQLRRTKSMPENTYYLYSENAGGNKVLFRTNSDSEVGQGIKACFADGSVSAKAYWTVKPVEGLKNVYTFQVPENDAEYVEGEYLGTDLYHNTEYTYGTTYGLYYDIRYDNNSQGCQWAFISVDEVKAAKEFFDLTEQLKELLIVADAKGIEDTKEHAVYDDFNSTEEQIEEAIQSLRSKLHYIEFMDTRARTLAVNTWDEDEDDELSLEEAAAVKSVGTVFRTASGIKSFDELRYFTGLTKLENEAFRGCSSLISIYIPSGVTEIGEKAFYSNSALKYMAVLNENGVVEASTANLPSGLNIFVPKSKMEAYAANETWAGCTVKEFTGIPTVNVEPAERQYGRSNPKFTFDVTGAPINGEPEMTSEAVAASPIGDYEVVAEAGTITTPGLVLVNGVLTVQRAPLTLTARSYSRNIGEENPEFKFTNSSLRNREKIDDVLTVQPTIECDATIDSPGGEYEIRISGAQADNYEIEYVNGKLTVIDPVGVRGIDADSKEKSLYDLAGRKVNVPKKGLYIVDKRKQIIK